MPSAFPRASDPSVLFLFSCLLTPPFVELYEGTFTWAATLNYLVHPMPLASIAVTALLLHFTHLDNPQITDSERMVFTCCFQPGA